MDDSPQEQVSREPLAARYAELWSDEGPPPDVFGFLEKNRPASARARVEVVLADLERRHAAGIPLPLEEYLARIPLLARDRKARLDVLLQQFLCLARNGNAPPPEVFARAYPRDCSALLERLRTTTDDTFDPHELVDAGGDRSEARPDLPDRYLIERIIGAGGFGIVYLAHDAELERRVAVKVPHSYRISELSDIESCLAEARIVARLDHPRVVPVYDAGPTSDGRYYVVSKFIEGGNLAARIERALPPFSESVALVVAVCEVLHYVHTQGIVHRDIKPGNILIDHRGGPLLTDFGLALREEDFGREITQGATPCYMSPEQARGEGHLVDGRSDIFSLGIVLYQLLTGTLPFLGSDREEVAQRIAKLEVRPLRQINDSIPKELERICMRALAKRVSDRYSTALDMAEDLRAFTAAVDGGCPAPLAAVRPEVLDSDALELAAGVIPKGLRSFDEEDAEFFLHLVPGPRDRHGLPEIIRFWKTRIEETDPDRTFRVGLIYGPSGGGKSSLVKAGLLPRLDRSVSVVFVEATGTATEQRLLAGIRKSLPGAPDDFPLTATLTHIRQGRTLPAGRKVLIVLDQFEQWLHAARSGSELVDALRQCDGRRIQCILLLRDDFWMAAVRFLNELDVHLTERQNSVAVDRMDQRHAHKVITAFGRAFGALPRYPAELTADQQAFLDASIAALAEADKLIPVRIAVFTEVVKAKPWTPATLGEIGGAEGVSVMFLEQIFNAPTSPPELRLHQAAARRVLQTLLPDPGDDIRGAARSYRELRKASGYEGRPRDFDELIQLLDSEVRLLRPVPPDVQPDASTAPATDGDLATDRHYQLTHDYLVPAVREWLTRKQKETRRGRWEILLADRAAQWVARKERRLLPSWWEWLSFRLITRPCDWTKVQQQMMRTAAKHHLLRAGVLLLGLLLLGGAGFEYLGRFKASAFHERLLDAAVSEVPQIVAQMDPYRRWATPLLRDSLRSLPAASRQHLNLSIALLPQDGEQVAYLRKRLMEATAEQFGVIRDVLRPHAAALTAELWEKVDGPGMRHNQRLRAACALAAFDPANPRWQELGGALAAWVVSELEIEPWILALRPVRSALRPQLLDVITRAANPEAERGAAILLSWLFEDDAELLVRIVPHAHPELLPLLAKKPGAQGALAVDLLQRVLARSLPAGSEEARDAHAREQANAALALALLGRDDCLWPLLERGDDPRVRSFLIDRFATAAVDPSLLAKRLAQETDESARRALILGLGAYESDALPAGTHEALVQSLQNMHRTDPDSGIHSAAAWLLRQWDIEPQALPRGRPEGARWYLTSEGQTMAVIRGPIEFVMGAPDDEPGRDDEDNQVHTVSIPRSFAISCCEVRMESFLRYRQHHFYETPPGGPDHPVTFVSYNDATQYCRWLSAQEGIPEDQWCYPPVRGLTEEGVSVVVEPYEDYLSRTGYRLPTEEEWEYACRAGARSCRFYGFAPELLDRYAWYRLSSRDRTHPVGRLKPNDLGLFDVYGNVWEWCETPLKNEGIRTYLALRGGSWIHPENQERSARTHLQLFVIRADNVGFRIARTVK